MAIDLNTPDAFFTYNENSALNFDDRPTLEGVIRGRDVARAAERIYTYTVDARHPTAGGTVTLREVREAIELFYPDQVGRLTTDTPVIVQLSGDGSWEIIKVIPEVSAAAKPFYMGISGDESDLSFIYGGPDRVQIQLGNDPNNPDNVANIIQQNFELTLNNGGINMLLGLNKFLLENHQLELVMRTDGSDTSFFLRDKQRPASSTAPTYELCVIDPNDPTEARDVGASGLTGLGIANGAKIGEVEVPKIARLARFKADASVVSAIASNTLPTVNTNATFWGPVQWEDFRYAASSDDWHVRWRAPGVRDTSGLVATGLPLGWNDSTDWPNLTYKIELAGYLAPTPAGIANFLSLGPIFRGWQSAHVAAASRTNSTDIEEWEMPGDLLPVLDDEADHVSRRGRSSTSGKARFRGSTALVSDGYRSRTFPADDFYTGILPDRAPTLDIHLQGDGITGTRAPTASDLIAAYAFGFRITPSHPKYGTGTPTIRYVAVLQALAHLEWVEAP